MIFVIEGYKMHQNINCEKVKGCFFNTLQDTEEYTEYVSGGCMSAYIYEHLLSI